MPHVSHQLGKAGATVITAVGGGVSMAAVAVAVAIAVDDGPAVAAACR